jgi:hypothetical protein
MAKRATQKPDAKAAAKVAAKAAKQAPAVPIAPPVSVEVSRSPSTGSPAEVLGFLPPRAALSVVVVTDAAGDAFQEGDLDPQDVTTIIVGSEPAKEPETLNSELPTEPTREGASADLASAGQTEQQPAEIVTPPAVQAPEINPAIELAKRYRTGTGKPMPGHPRYYTAPPPDLRTRAQRERDEGKKTKG